MKTYHLPCTQQEFDLLKHVRDKMRTKQQSGTETKHFTDGNVIITEEHSGAGERDTLVVAIYILK